VSQVAKKEVTDRKKPHSVETDKAEGGNAAFSFG